ncbi:MAG: hypothetical protein ABJB74_03680 [Gemmatimonas sp.]
MRATIGAGPQRTGVMTHWNYDTFRAVLGDGRNAPIRLQFQLNADATVARVMLNEKEKYSFARISVSAFE